MLGINRKADHMAVRRAIVIAGAGTIFCLPAPALAHDPGLARCLAIADRDARLSCYDAIARAEQGAAASARPAPPAATASPGMAAPAPNPRAEFGFGAAEREERRAVEQRPIDEITVRVKEAREVGAGYWQFVMDDGSIWRLAETRSSYRMPRANDDVKLVRASLGSYLLVFRNQASLRIRRID